MLKKCGFRAVVGSLLVRLVRWVLLKERAKNAVLGLLWLYPLYKGIERLMEILQVLGNCLAKS
jgi:hypothetical protein